MLKTIIIDDEPRARKAITDILKLGTTDVELVAEGYDVKTGLEVVRKHHPDLVFLDIDMPDGTGFDLLRQLDDIHFKVIFITAFEEFAVRAFEFSAFDYILKPVDPPKLLHAVSRASEIVEQENIALKLNALFSNLENSTGKRKRLVLHTDDKIHVVNTNDINRCKSDLGYTQFYLMDGRKVIVSKNLKHFDELLIGCGFFRTHQSHLINLSYIDYYEKRDGGYVVMKDGSYVPVSQRKREPFFKLMKML